MVDPAFGANLREAIQAKQQESFERSSVKLTLKHLGASNMQIRMLEAQHGEYFGWQWFNDLGVVPAEVTSLRVFSYNFWQMYFKEGTGELVAALRSLGLFDGADRAVIFQVQGCGRQVATNLQLDTSTDTFLNVNTRHGTFRVQPLETFFPRWADPDIWR